ncbi:MAG: type III-A CRISPR-associated RAMP protein Csm3 [Prevotella sp.]|nr:type III-A CRISPR-associated RAMP protein Csm3 [Prevotella sp.]MBR1463522.1 type III-A CRISPR-associated RAMP protein Csm3 [Prevotella sp.]
MKQLVKKIKINTSITLITGLHIGGNSENVEIGGIDNPVVKLASKGDVPYIPGSSLKGKMRCLLEQAAGAPKVGLDEKVNNLFGITESRANNTSNQPSKIIVRDAMLSDDSKKILLDCDNLDMPYTENKFENVIDRVKGIAQHPRQTERVPAGAEFNAEFIINVWDDDNEQELMALFEKGIRLLENDYLGGSGSRGYGQIKFGEMKRTELSDANNWTA